MGFEPTEPARGLGSFQDCCLRPLGHPSGAHQQPGAVRQSRTVTWNRGSSSAKPNCKPASRSEAGAEGVGFELSPLRSLPADPSPLTLAQPRRTGAAVRQSRTANLLRFRGEAGAEGVGFEPTEPANRLNSFQDCRLRPLGHPSETPPLRCDVGVYRAQNKPRVRVTRSHSTTRREIAMITNTTRMAIMVSHCLSRDGGAVSFTATTVLGRASPTALIT